jgi:hypothetical protein
MSEIAQSVSEGVLGQDEQAPERGRPGTNPPEEPQPGMDPGAGEPAEQDQPEQGLGEPDSH